MKRVLIVESPSLQDITTGDRTGELLAGQLRLLRIPCELRTIHTAELLEKRLREESHKSDIIHLSMHGNEDGIQFTDTTCMGWDELQHQLLRYAGGKLLVVSACRSSTFVPDADLAKTMQALTNGGAQAAKCVFTMFGDVYFVDSVLAWGLFYRRLHDKLKGASIAQCMAEQVKESLDSVRRAGFAKICAAFWYEQYGKYKNISPWIPELKPNKPARTRNK